MRSPRVKGESESKCKVIFTKNVKIKKMKTAKSCFLRPLSKTTSSLNSSLWNFEQRWKQREAKLIFGLSLKTVKQESLFSSFDFEQQNFKKQQRQNKKSSWIQMRNNVIKLDTIKTDCVPVQLCGLNVAWNSYVKCVGPSLLMISFVGYKEACTKIFSSL